MPPSVLTSNDRADVESALASQPKFTDPQVKALYNWVLRLVTALFNYVSFFLGDNSDRTDNLIHRVQALEEKSQVPQQPQSTTPSITPQQPSAPSKRSRCRRCSALGHDTNQCRTKDPITVKKRVTNNQKARKQARDPPFSLGGLPFPTAPPQYSPFYGPRGVTDLFGDPLFGYSSPTPQAFTALAADAKELRRRKVQSTRDKRRRGVTTTTTN